VAEAERGAGRRAAWTFRAAELVVQNASGERFRAPLSFEGTAEARAAKRLLKFLGSAHQAYPAWCRA